jgi:hypothetical protein
LEDSSEQLAQKPFIPSTKHTDRAFPAAPSERRKPMTIDFAMSPALINSLTPSAPADLSELGSTADLSPDALMAYCQARLDSIDSQVKTTFTQQEQRNTEQGDLQQALATLQKYSAGFMDANNANCLDMENALYGQIMQIKQTDPGNPQLGALEQTYNSLVATGSGGYDSPNNAIDPSQPTKMPFIDSATYPPAPTDPPGDGKVGSDEMQGFINSVQGAISDLNSGAELQMIQLQSLMSQRETAVQLTTNLVQSLGDQLNKIADNIGY